jgi:hypothetical protein
MVLRLLGTMGAGLKLTEAWPDQETIKAARRHLSFLTPSYSLCWISLTTVISEAES